MKLVVNAKRCPQNHRCPAMAVCPKKAISQKNIFSLPVIDDHQCIVCGKCIQYCPMGAFEKSGRRERPIIGISNDYCPLGGMGAAPTAPALSMAV